MKILHIGLSATGFPLNGLQKALMKLGEYIEIDTATPNINQVIRQKSDSFRPDLVWIQVQTDGVLGIDTMQYLRKNGAFVINWTGDVRSPIPYFYEGLGKEIDLTCFSNMTDVELLSAKGVKCDFHHIGYDPEIYTPKGNKITAPEIVFLGNNFGKAFPLSGYRADMVKYLQSTYREEFGVYGNGWPKLNGTFMGNQMGEASLYRSCKIAINCSHFEYKRYSSDRMLRIMGSGAFCLTKWYPGLDEDFNPGIDCVQWHDFDELKYLIDYYLDEKNENQRQAIAEKGQINVSTNLTFDKMAQSIYQLYLKYKI